MKNSFTNSTYITAGSFIIYTFIIYSFLNPLFLIIITLSDSIGGPKVVVDILSNYYWLYSLIWTFSYLMHFGCLYIINKYVLDIHHRYFIFYEDEIPTRLFFIAIILLLIQSFLFFEILYQIQILPCWHNALQIFWTSFILFLTKIKIFFISFYKSYNAKVGLFDLTLFTNTLIKYFPFFLKSFGSVEGLQTYLNPALRLNIIIWCNLFVCLYLFYYIKSWHLLPPFYKNLEFYKQYTYINNSEETNYYYRVLILAFISFSTLFALAFCTTFSNFGYFYPLKWCSVLLDNGVRDLVWSNEFILNNWSTQFKVPIFFPEIYNFGFYIVISEFRFYIWFLFSLSLLGRICYNYFFSMHRLHIYRETNIRLYRYYIITYIHFLMLLFIADPIWLWYIFFYWAAYYFFESFGLYDNIIFYPRTPEQEKQDGIKAKRIWAKLKYKHFGIGEEYIDVNKSAFKTKMTKELEQEFDEIEKSEVHSPETKRVSRLQKINIINFNKDEDFRQQYRDIKERVCGKDIFHGDEQTYLNQTDLVKNSNLEKILTKSKVIKNIKNQTDPLPDAGFTLYTREEMQRYRTWGAFFFYLINRFLLIRLIIALIFGI
jgi:hypothetical protein